MGYLILWLLCGLTAAVIYKNKGRSAGTAFLVGVILGPIGVLLAILSSTDTATIQRQQIAHGEMKKCPSVPS